MYAGSCALVAQLSGKCIDCPITFSLLPVAEQMTNVTNQIIPVQPVRIEVCRISVSQGDGLVGRLNWFGRVQQLRRSYLICGGNGLRMQQLPSLTDADFLS